MKSHVNAALDWINGDGGARFLAPAPSDDGGGDHGTMFVFVASSTMTRPLDTIGDVGAHLVRGEGLNVAASTTPAAPAFCRGFVSSTSTALFQQPRRQGVCVSYSRLVWCWLA
jgi:hypothetical protein